jgi:hypothetical protein
MQEIIEFFSYLWSVAGIPLLLLFIPGLILDEISKIIETAIRQGIRQRFYKELGQYQANLEFSEFGEKIFKRYQVNPQLWNRMTNVIFAAGHIMIILAGYVLLGFLGLILFIVMDSPFIRIRLKRPDVEVREMWAMKSESGTE